MGDAVPCYSRIRGDEAGHRTGWKACATQRPHALVLHRYCPAGYVNLEYALGSWGAADEARPGGMNPWLGLAPFRANTRSRAFAFPKSQELIRYNSLLPSEHMYG